jgi:hypothetical protein
LLWDSVEAAFQTKAFELALHLLEELEAHPLAHLQQAQVLAKRIAIVTFTREGDATGMTLAALRRYGVRWPRRPSALRIRWEILRTDWMLRGPLDERLFPPVRATRDARWMAPVLVFSAGGAALVRTSIALPFFSASYALRAQRRHGVARGPGFALAVYAAFRIALLGTPKGAERYARAAIEWMARMPNLVLDVRGEFELQAFVYPWIRPRRSVLEPLRLICERARDTGDLEYFTYANRNRAVYAALCGEPLLPVLEQFELMDRRERLHGGGYFFAEYLRAYQLLRPGAPEAQPWRESLAAAEQSLGGALDSGLYIWIHWVIVLTFLGEHAAALQLAERLSTAVFSKGMLGSSVVDYTLFRGVSAAVLAASGAAGVRRRCVRIARRCARQLAGWARHGPDFAHMSLFVQAELARARRDDARALRLYAAAARGAIEHGYRHHAALLHERRADLLHSRSRHTEWGVAIREAHGLYLAWGASTKVQALKKRESELRHAPS